MQVVQAGHARLRLQRALDLGQVDLVGHAFEQHVEALAQEAPGARQHPQADGDGDHRVDPGPAGETDDERARDHADGAEHVGPHLEVRALHVEALVLAAGQQAHADEVDHQAADGHEQHHGRLDLGRLRDAPVRLVEHVDRHEEQQHRVDHGRQDLEAVVAEGAALVRRPLAQPDGGQRDGQRHGVGGHVGRVGQQRQAARHQPADHLGDEVGRGQRQRPAQRLLVATSNGCGV
ncbi:hypothetical protein FQZ97_476250 [compost metagenome]